MPRTKLTRIHAEVDFEKDGVQHGFLLSGGAFSTIDYSGATDTTAVGINAGRDIVGAHTNGGVQMAMS